MQAAVKNRFGRLIRIAAALAAVYLFIRFVLPVLAPFMLAFGAAALLQSPVRFLSRRLKLRRNICAVFCSAAFIAAIAAFGIILVRWIARDLAKVIESLPDAAAGLPSVLREADERLYKLIVAAPVELQDFLGSALESLRGAINELPITLYNRAMTFVSGIAASAPGVLFFTAAMTVGLFFICPAYPEIIAFFRRQIPADRLSRADEALPILGKTLGSWFKAETILSCLCFCELFAAFMLLDVRRPALLALVAALVDALPFLGTGILLLPWSAVCLLGGQMPRGIALLALWSVIGLVRGLLEPKLLGGSSGVHPAAAALAIYAGFKLLGIAGMLLFPISLMLLTALNKKGCLRLWK